jgi:hypothetical protein
VKSGKLSGRRCRRACVLLPPVGSPGDGLGLSQSLVLIQMRTLLEGGLATRSTGRSTKLDGLVPPILSVHSDHLAHLLWYCGCDLFLFSGCAHRRCDRDNRDRRQPDDHFAYHGAYSNVRIAPQPLTLKLNSSDTVARVRQYRAASPEHRALSEHAPRTRSSDSAFQRCRFRE